MLGKAFNVAFQQDIKLEAPPSPCEAPLIRMAQIPTKYRLKTDMTPEEIDERMYDFCLTLWKRWC